MNTHNTTFDDIIDELMFEESEPTHEALIRWCDRYPQHSEALARFFATWAVQKELPEQVSVDENRIADRLVSHALNLAYSQSTGQAVDSTDAAPLRLCDAIAASGISEDEFATRCVLDDSIIAKFDRRLIPVKTIPRTCIDRIGTALGRAAAAVVAMLAGDAIPLGSYKATGRPATKQQDFLDAVKSSDLPDEAKSEWIRIATSEQGSEADE